MEKKADLYSKKLSTVLYSFELRLKFAPTSTKTEISFNVITRSNTFKWLLVSKTKKPWWTDGPMLPTVIMTHHTHSLRCDEEDETEAAKPGQVLKKTLFIYLCSATRLGPNWPAPPPTTLPSSSSTSSFSSSSSSSSSLYRPSVASSFQLFLFFVFSFNLII